jgi:hypothetical protein
MIRRILTTKFTKDTKNCQGKIFFKNDVNPIYAFAFLGEVGALGGFKFSFFDLVRGLK